MFRFSLAILLLLFTIPAHAQQQPCQRGQSSVQMGGIDMDILKCQLVLDADKMGGLTAQITSLTATLVLTKDDLLKAQQELTKVQKEVEELRKPKE